MDKAARAVGWSHAVVPELPDIEAYLHAQRLLGHPTMAIRMGSPFLVRTTDPPVEAAIGRTVTSLRRVDKRIAIAAQLAAEALRLTAPSRPAWRVSLWPVHP